MGGKIFGCDLWPITKVKLNLQINVLFGREKGFQVQFKICVNMPKVQSRFNNQLMLTLWKTIQYATLDRPAISFWLMACQLMHFMFLLLIFPEEFFYFKLKPKRLWHVEKGNHSELERVQKRVCCIQSIKVTQRVLDWAKLI